MGKKAWKTAAMASRPTEERIVAMSILSTRPDGFGYYYAHREGDHRQINVREEGTTDFSYWRAYVGGEEIPGDYDSKVSAEAAAIAWAEANPPEKE